ncbi:MAG: hypothetical protein KC516_02815 [Nanoarchaeota archaeon]|nr:hypothetical protein [Nanoarchaeota archaeon]
MKPKKNIGEKSKLQEILFYESKGSSRINPLGDSSKQYAKLNFLIHQSIKKYEEVHIKLEKKEGGFYSFRLYKK